MISLYEHISIIKDWLSNLYNMVQNPNPFLNPENEIINMLMKQREIKFDKRHLESVSETALVPQEFFVQKILPLISLAGVLYATNKHIYFQTLNSALSKPCKKIPISNLTELYCRRYELISVFLQAFQSLIIGFC